MAIKGQDLRVKVGSNVIAAATSCTVHIAANTEDASTKDTTGDWAVNEAVGKSWDVSADALVVSSGSNNAKSLLGMIGTTVTLTFNNGSTQWMTGSAIVSDVSITAANRQNGTVTVQFTGTGALTIA